MNDSNIIKIQLTPTLHSHILKITSNNSNKNYSQRIKERKNYNEDDLIIIGNESNDLKDIQSNSSYFEDRKKNKKKKNKLISLGRKRKQSNLSSSLSEKENNYVPSYINKINKIGLFGIDQNPVKFKEIRKECFNIINMTKKLQVKLENEFISKETTNLNNSNLTCPELSIPILADIRNFNFNDLIDFHQKEFNKLFDVVLMDPPWHIGSSNPTRGVSISYPTLNDNLITNLPINNLQTDGFIFIWTVNSKYSLTFDLLDKWGYSFCDEIIWIKQTINGKLAKGNGYYLQHSKESCIVGIKGAPNYTKNVCSDIIYSLRRGQSQKPDEIYTYIESLVPNGNYIELFGRRNNLRDKWITIGNEL